MFFVQFEDIVGWRLQHNRFPPPFPAHAGPALMYQRLDVIVITTVATFFFVVFILLLNIA
jgi:hypothetical protein